MASRRRSPSLDYLESRNLLSAAPSVFAEVASLHHLVPFVATETLTSRTSTPVSPVINRVTHTNIGNGFPLGRNFTDSSSANEPNPVPSGVFPLTDGTVTFGTANGSSTLTGTFTGKARFVTDPVTGDLHAIFTLHITITGGTGRFAGATGEITQLGNSDVTTSTGHVEDFGFISTASSKT